MFYSVHVKLNLQYNGGNKDVYIILRMVCNYKWI